MTLRPRRRILSAPHSTAGDRELLRRLTIVIVSRLFSSSPRSCDLELVFGRKFFDVSGPARWIWPQVDRISNELPVTFFATRDFALPAKPLLHEDLKSLGDPEYTLYFNGTGDRGDARRRMRRKRQRRSTSTT